jgi:hypothetical protein
MKKLENIRNDNDDIFDSTLIYSPLGEVEDKFRYIVIMTPKINCVFENDKLSSLKSLIAKYLYDNGAVLEKIVLFSDYVLITVLISINIPVDKVLMRVLRKNRSLFRQHYFVTNTEFPDEDTIKEYLDIAKEFDPIKS